MGRKKMQSKRVWLANATGGPRFVTMPEDGAARPDHEGTTTLRGIGIYLPEPVADAKRRYPAEMARALEALCPLADTTEETARRLGEIFGAGVYYQGIVEPCGSVCPDEVEPDMALRAVLAEDGRRVWRKVSKSEVADLLGISRPTLDRYIENPGRLDTWQAECLVGVLGYTDVEHFLTGESSIARWKRAKNDPHNPNSTAYRKDRHEFAEALTLYATLGEDSRTKALEFMRGLLLSEHARNGQIDGDGMTDGIEGARARVAEVTRGALAGYGPEARGELAGLISYAMHEDAGAHAQRIAAMPPRRADVAGM